MDIITAFVDYLVNEVDSPEVTICFSKNRSCYLEKGELTFISDTGNIISIARDNNFINELKSRLPNYNIEIDIKQQGCVLRFTRVNNIE